MSVISPGNKAFKKSSCTRRTAFSRTAKSPARVDLPAAIFPQKNINFAEFFWPILDKKYHGLTAKSRLVAKPDEWLIVPTWDVTPLIGTLQEQTHLRCHREV